MSMSSVGDSPASQLAAQEKGKAKKTRAGYGRSSAESFAAFGQNGCLSKMYRGCYLLTLEGSLLEYCETFPKAGMMRNGILYRLPALAHRTSGDECSLWPTAQANKTTPNVKNPGDLVNSKGEPWRTGEKPYDRRTGKPVTTCLGDAVRMWPTPTKSDGMGGPGCSGRDGGENLRTAVQMWPTPTASLANPSSETWDESKPWWKQSRASRNLEALAKHPERLPTPAARDCRSPNQNGNMADQLPNVVGGSLNADWVELLMGFPRGWTDLGAKDGKMEPPESQRAKKTE